jgi:hypothetical protein
MSAAVGADIENVCTKCGDVWHVVVAKDGERIVKVQCKQCGGYHRYRDPNPGAAKAVRRTSSSPKAPRQSKPVERFETPAVAADLTREARTYKVSERYEVGDRVEHPSFGQGVVETTSEPGKMTVFFAVGRKVLVHAKGDGKGGALEKPRPFDHTKPDPNLMSPGKHATAVLGLDSSDGLEPDEADDEPADDDDEDDDETSAEADNAI